MSRTYLLEAFIRLTVKISIQQLATDGNIKDFGLIFKNCFILAKGH